MDDLCSPSKILPLKLLLASVALILLATKEVQCFSSGAPSAACSTLSPDPGQHLAPPQSTPPPYSIDLSGFDVVSGSFVYDPGNSYQITLSANPGSSFRGFLVQARQVADNTTPLGSFTGFSSTTARFSSCSPPEHSVTHLTSVVKTSETFTWTAPPAGSGSVSFGFAVVFQRDVYWANQRSAVIEERVDCGTLPNPNNGLVTLSGTSEGSIATYTCDTGFELVPNFGRICQADGTWSGMDPTCQSVAVDCGGLPNPTNGQVSLTGTAQGSTATYTCNPGYIPTGGDSTRFCQANGQWSGSPLICDFVDCGGLPDPANGIVTLSGTVVGSTATYTCDSGFELVPDSNRVCQADGTWSGIDPTCEAVDSEIVLELSSSVYYTDEGDTFVTITITKSTVTAEDIDVIISLSDGTALGGIDYGPFPADDVNLTHTIPGPNTQSLFGIQIREDTIVEPTESFTVELFLPTPGQPQVVIGTINRATVFIHDNDVRIGLGDDPHYSILLPTGHLLCYTVQGEHNFTFNLITNSLLQMNALFIPDKYREEVTWIGALGIVVKSPYKDLAVTKLRFALEGQMLYIGDKVKLSVKNVEKISLSGGKMVISEAMGEMQVPEVKVELNDIGLSFFVRYMSNHLDMIWDSVTAQPKDSHGMIGQFFRPGVDIDEVRRLLVLPTLDSVPVMRRPVWAFMERDIPDDQLCWTAMNPGYQGKGLLEGTYLDYLVDDVLSDAFKFVS